MTGNLRIDIVYIYFENNSSMICSWWFLHKFSENHHLLSKGKLCTRVLYLHHKQMLNYPASDKILDYIITCQIRGLFFFYHRMLFWIAFEKKNHQYFQKSLFSRWVSALWNFDRRPYTLVLCLTHGKACQGYWRACIIMVHFSGDFNSDLVGCIINVQIEINILHKLGKLVFHHDSKQLHIVGFFSGRQSHSPRLGSHILAQQ